MLSFSQLTFLVLSTWCNSARTRPADSGSHQPGELSVPAECALGIEGMSIAAKLWAVVLLVSEVHYRHHGAATGFFWKMAKAAR